MTLMINARRASYAAVMLATCSAAPMAFAQEAKPVKFAVMAYDDDFSYMADSSQRDSAWSQIKYIPLGDEAYLSIGGEARVRSETRNHLNFGRGVEDNGFDMQHRLRVWGDLNVTKNVRVFGELQATGTNGADLPSRNPVDHNVFEGHQLFIETTTEFGEDGNVFFRAGRQEISLGKARLFDTRNGPNSRRSFDAARFVATTNDWRIGVIGGKAVQDLKGEWNNETNDGLKYVAAHAARSFNGFAGTGEVELVYLHTNQETARIADLNSDRDTLSVRVGARKDALTYDIETILQGGDTLAGKSVDAWFVGVEAGYQLPGAWNPRLGTRIDVGSGDKDAADNKTNGFDSMWGRGQSFTTEFGYTNMVQAGLNVNVNPMPKVSANIGATLLRRVEKADGVYSMAPSLMVAGNEGTSKDVGVRYTARADYALNSFVSFGALVNYVNAGDFMKEAGSSDDLLYTSVFVTTRF